MDFLFSSVQLHYAINLRFLYYKIGIIIPFSGHNKVIPQNKSARYNVIEVNDYAD